MGADGPALPTPLARLIDSARRIGLELDIRPPAEPGGDHSLFRVRVEDWQTFLDHVATHDHEGPALPRRGPRPSHRRRPFSPANAGALLPILTAARRWGLVLSAHPNGTLAGVRVDDLALLRRAAGSGAS